jgi:cation transport regulator ChaC
MVLWVFGYGSLIWKTGFEYDERVVGFIKGYTRVFNQASTDHRGTREYPGRTVTLEPQEGARVDGCAYRVTGYDAEQLVLSYLELREFEYDIRTFVDFYTDDSPNQPAITGVLVYIGSPCRTKNQYYLGSAPLRDMANQIATARGPAGTNYEYLFRLEEALYDIGCVDQYIIDLANEVRKILGVYEDRKQVVQKFEDEKPQESFDHDKKLLKAFQKEEKMLLKEDKLLLNRQKLLKSFDDRKLLDKCEAIVC